MDTDLGRAACGARTQAEEREYTSQQRAALVAWHLAHGEGMRTVDVAKLTGLGQIGAWRLMCKLAGVLPIYQESGVWQACYLGEIQ